MGRGISNSRSSPARSKHAVGGFSLRHLIQAIAKRKEGIERDEMLVFEYGTHSAGQFLMDALAVGGVLTRACKQIDDLAWRDRSAGPPAATMSSPRELRVESKS